MTRWWGGVRTRGREADPWLVVGPGQPQEQISGLETKYLYVSVKQK